MPRFISPHHASTISYENVASELQVNIKNGLTSSEASVRQLEVGLNELVTDEPQSLIMKYLDQFKEPMILLLLGSAVLSLFMKQYDDAISITCALFIVCTVAFIQGYQSEKVLESLKKLMPPRCNCIRDGVLIEFDAINLVPGDIVSISLGDKVPADMRLFESTELEVDESNLTGEVMPVRKNDGILPLLNSSTTMFVNDKSSSDSNLELSGKLRSSMDNPYIDKDFAQNYYSVKTTSDQVHFPSNDLKIDTGLLSKLDTHDLNNIAFMGTMIRGGNAKGIVIATGKNSTFGEVFRLMESEESPKTPLQKGMDRLGKQLTIVSISIIVLISLLALIQQREWLELFTISVSLAVAAIPEGLPIVVTVTLAIGQRRMASRNAIVKKLPAVETLGCIKTICSDKTGTLTQNQMSVTKIITSGVECVQVTNGEILNQISLTWLSDGNAISPYESNMMGSYDVNSPTRHPTVKRMIEIGCLCNNASLNNDIINGQPTEGALLLLGNKCGIPDPRNTQQRICEWPFNSETKMMIVQTAPREFKNDLDLKNKKITFFAKGSPETIIEQCNYHRQALNINKISMNDDAKISEFSKDKKNKFLEIASNMGRTGLRILALAEGSSEKDLIFTGLFALMDPLRVGVKESINKMQTSGVNVVMITGDSRETACSIGESLSIFGPHDRCLSGLEVERMSTDELTNMAGNISIFYRTSPKHKSKIVKAYQNLGLIVAMTGDGVNDAVAVKSADVGIAMGLGGTDVCKEAADIVLVDNNFSSILSAIEEGKSIYQNIQNFIRFQLSTSISALSLIAFSTILRIQSPLNAIQILYINILMDGPPAQSLGLEPPDDDVVNQPPRRVSDSILDLKLFMDILLSAGFIVTGTLGMFFHSLSQGNSPEHASTVAFTSFVFFGIFNALSCRSHIRPIWEIGFFKNRMFIITVSINIIGQLLLIYVSLFQSIFQTQPVSFKELILITMVSSTVFWMNEFRKLCRLNCRYSMALTSFRYKCAPFTRWLSCSLFKISRFFIYQFNLRPRRYPREENLIV